MPDKGKEEEEFDFLCLEEIINDENYFN